MSICFNCGYTIKGGVSYTVETARQISFADVSKNIDIKQYKNYLHDEYFCKNMEAKTHHKNKFKNRSVTFFSDGTYGVVYKSNRNRGYYYDGKGDLEFIEISKTKFYQKNMSDIIKREVLIPNCFSAQHQEKHIFLIRIRNLLLIG